LILYYNKDYEPALENTKQTIESSPDSYDAIRLEGDIYRDLSQLHERMENCRARKIITSNQKLLTIPRLKSREVIINHSKDYAPLNRR